MNAATRGVILAIVAVVLGVIILGQGFGDSAPTLQSVSTDPAPSDDGSSDGTATGDGAADDSSAGDSSEPAADDGSSDDGSSDDSSGDDTTAADDGTSGDDGADSTLPEEDPDTPDILHPPAEVRVLVANGTTVAGFAGTTSDQLVSDRGYGGIGAVNATEAFEQTAIFYAAGYELDAIQIAQILNAPPGAVAPMPADPPVADLEQAHVLVVMGSDLVPG